MVLVLEIVDAGVPAYFCVDCCAEHGAMALPRSNLYAYVEVVERHVMGGHLAGHHDRELVIRRMRGLDDVRTAVMERRCAA
ncbi:MAG: hypothetical protein OXK17_08470 [Thaumarchaeota archaeon]|nr:hypothetical protein [Nitrososphaerota archaeon]